LDPPARVLVAGGEPKLPTAAWSSRPLGAGSLGACRSAEVALSCETGQRGKPADTSRGLAAMAQAFFARRRRRRATFGAAFAPFL